MDRWMDVMVGKWLVVGLMDGWIDGWMDGWRGEQVGAWMNG